MTSGLRSMVARAALLGLLAALVCCTGSGADDGPPGTPKRALKAVVSGRWRQLERAVKGRVLDDPPDVTFTFTKGDMLQHRAPDGTVVENVHFELDGSATPAKIDCWGRSDRSDLERGILRVDGNRVLLAFSKPGAERPLRFESGDRPGDAHLSCKLER